MGKNFSKKILFLSMEYLGTFAGVWAFLFFFKSWFSRFIAGLFKSSSVPALFQDFFSGIKWAVISLFTIFFVYIIRKIKSGWTVRDLSFRINRSWGKDIRFGITIFSATYVISLPVTLAVFSSKAQLAGESFLSKMSSVASPFYLLIPAALFIAFSTFLCAFWEEISWRGYLQNLFTREISPATGFFISVFFFSLGHYFTRPEWGMLDILCCLIWGIVFCLAFYATGSLLVVTVIHGLSNLFWVYPFYLYLNGITVSSYGFIVALGILLLIWCFFCRKELDYFFLKAKDLFVRSGWKMSLVGIFLGVVALCYSWAQAELLKKFNQGMALFLLVIFSVFVLGLSFVYKNRRKSERTSPK